MRLYLPLTHPELGLDRPPAREGFVAEINAIEAPDQAFEDTLHDASFASLELLQISENEGGRVVAVGDVPAGQSHFESWDEVESLMADGSRGRLLVQEVLVAPDQERAEAALEELFDEPLEWFDVSERKQLSER